MQDVHRGRAVSTKIDSMAFDAVYSGKQENVDELVKNKELAYNSVIQDLRNRQQSRESDNMQKVLESMHLAIDDTKEDRQIRDMVMQLAKNQSLLNSQTTGDSRITED